MLCDMRQWGAGELICMGHCDADFTLGLWQSQPYICQGTDGTKWYGGELYEEPKGSGIMVKWDGITCQGARHHIPPCARTHIHGAHMIRSSKAYCRNDTV